jgi:hypothetical protein
MMSIRRPPGILVYPNGSSLRLKQKGKDSSYLRKDCKMKKFSIVTVVFMALIGFGVGSAFSGEIGIMVSPSTINLNSEGEWVTVHADIPLAGVVTASLTLNGVNVAWTKADNHLDLVAKFAVDEVKSILSPGSAELVLSGVVATPEGDQPFHGADTIKVVKEGKE